MTTNRPRISRTLHMNISGTHFSRCLDLAARCGWETRDNVVVATAEIHHPANGPPHIPPRAWTRVLTWRARQRQTHASNLYRINNRMILWQSEQLLWALLLARKRQLSRGHSARLVPVTVETWRLMHSLNWKTERMQCKCIVGKLICYINYIQFIKLFQQNSFYIFS